MGDVNRADVANAIRCPVFTTAASDPNLLAIQSTDVTLTYLDLEDLVSKVASALVEEGLSHGSRVAVLVERDWQTIVLFWALLRIGAVVVPLDRREPDRRLQHQVAISGCRVCISDKSSALDRGWCETELNRETLLDGWSSSAEPASPDAPPPNLDLRDLATIVFTSGSAGISKGAINTLANHWFSAKGSQTMLPVGPGDKWLAALPFFHVSGLSIVFRCFQNRGCVVLPGEDGIGGSIRRFGVTHLSLVPAQLRRLVDAVETDGASTLRFILVGGGPLPKRLQEHAASQGLPVVPTYGLTEMASQVVTAGRVLPGVEVRLATDGEILVRGATRFYGYADNDQVEYPFDDDGWFATGDLGSFGAGGELSIIGRKDNQFISGGENVSPEEIECAILETGLVDHTVVVGVPDREFGKRPVAFVSPLPDEDTLRDALRNRIADFKVPDRFLQLPEIEVGLKHRRSDLLRLVTPT